MKTIALLLLLPLAATAAKTKPTKVDSSCGKVALAAIYGAEKSYESEFGVFNDSFQEIGYRPEKGSCSEDWNITVRIFNGGKEFLGEAIHKESGETWTINQKKMLVQERTQ